MKRVVAFILLLHVNLFSQTIHVKYIGEVDLNGYEKINIAPSSFINKLYYNNSSQRAIVLLNKTYYMYCGIWDTDILSWRTANSAGSHYNQYIKGNFKCN